MHMSPPYPGSLGCCSLSGGGSVFDLLRSSHCLWGFVLAALLYVLTKFAIILTRKRELLALRLDVLLL